MRHMKNAVIAAFMFAAISSSSMATVEEKPLKLVMPIASGLSMGSTSQIVKDIGKALEKRLGRKVESTEFRYKRDMDIAKAIYDKTKKGELDLALIAPREYFSLQRLEKDLLNPLVTVTFFGKPTITACMYTRKADAVKSLASMKGKKWGGASIIATRYLMHKNGIPDAPAKFFKSMTYLADENVTNNLNALISKKIDVFILGSFQVDMAKNADKRFKDIEATNCFEYDHSWLIVYKKGTPPDAVEKIKTSFINAHKDKEFAQFKFLFAAIQGHFVAYDPAKMKTAQEVYNLSLKNKWDQEERAFIKANIK